MRSADIQEVDDARNDRIVPSGPPPIIVLISVPKVSDSIRSEAHQRVGALAYPVVNRWKLNG